MNPRTPDHVDLNEERLARDLRAAARQIDLTPGSELSVVTRGRRRRQRQRRVTTFTLVTALTAGTAVGVQQLSRNGDDSISSQQVDDTIPTPPTDPSAPGTTAPAVPPPVATVAPLVAPTTGIEIPDDVPPAVPAEPGMTWTVVEPDSTQAVGWTINNYGADTVSRVPGLLLSTAPGRSDGYEPTLWRTEDGVTWSVADVGVPIGAPGSVVIDGSSLYNVGTAPGIAAGEPNPLRLAASVDGGVSWQETELPLDTNEGRDLPLVLGASVYGIPMPIDGGVFVLVNHSLGLDWEELARTDERLRYGFVEMRSEGVTVPVDPECLPTATTIPFGGSSGALMPLVPAEEATAEPPCLTDAELLTWDEIGVPEETAAAVAGASTHAFIVLGDQVTEVDVQAGLSYAGSFEGAQWLTDADGGWYRVGRDGTIVRSEPPGDASGFGWRIGSVGDVSFSMVQRPTNFSMSQDIVMATDTESVVWSDWSTLYGDDVLPFRNAVGTTESGIVSVVQAQVQEPIRDGDWEVSDGGMTIRRASMRLDPTFVVTDTGEQLPLDRVRLDTENGDLVAVDRLGNEIARMARDTANPILYGAGAGGTVPPSEWYVETSADGRNVAVERLASLLGVDDAGISSVSRISTDGTRTIVAVTLTERNADGVPRQLVLVGTPKG